jgi:hypothetical protein
VLGLNYLAPFKLPQEYIDIMGGFDSANSNIFDHLLKWDSWLLEKDMKILQCWLRLWKKVLIFN